MCEESFVTGHVETSNSREYGSATTKKQVREGPKVLVSEGAVGYLE